MAERPLLLDTHIWIWLANRDAKLSANAQLAINHAASSSGVLIAAISVWEVAMLESSHRIKLLGSIHKWVEDALAAPGIVLAPLTANIALESCNLPGKFHSDPADRMIVATARLMNSTLLTHDDKIINYANAGYVQAVAL